MKASELIKKLQQITKKQGDVELEVVYIYKNHPTAPERLCSDRDGVAMGVAVVDEESNPKEFIEGLWHYEDLGESLW